MNISNTNEYLFPILYTCINYNPPMYPYNYQQSILPGDILVYICSEAATVYSVRKQQEVGQWQSQRDSFFNASLHRFSPASFVCVICEEETEKPARCRDCGPCYIACEKCCRKDHTFRPLHHVEIWQVRFDYK